MPRIHPKSWDDGIMPLDQFPPSHQAEIAHLVARRTPPPRLLSLPECEIESRAWHEWHWARGEKLRYVPSDGRKYRRKIPAALRQAVYERDENRCRHCGTTQGLSVDHIHPWSLGGADELGNLQTLCRSCNSRKGART